MIHAADCPCFDCGLAHMKGFMEQFKHEPMYEREEERCPVCEVRRGDHDDVFPCQLDEQD